MQFCYTLLNSLAKYLTQAFNQKIAVKSVERQTMEQEMLQYFTCIKAKRLFFGGVYVGIINSKKKSARKRHNIAQYVRFNLIKNQCFEIKTILK